jgi:hypothetical protein
LPKIYTAIKKFNVSETWAFERHQEWIESEMINASSEIQEMQVEQKERGVNWLNEKVITDRQHYLSLLCQRHQYCSKVLSGALMAERMKENHEDRLSKALTVPIQTLIPYNPLWKGGNKLRYTSPLRDKSDGKSFAVDTDKNVWYDFVLGEGGNVVNLYMRMYAVDFKEAIKELAKIAI